MLEQLRAMDWQLAFGRMEVCVNRGCGQPRKGKGSDGSHVISGFFFGSQKHRTPCGPPKKRHPT